MICGETVMLAEEFAKIPILCRPLFDLADDSLDLPAWDGGISKNLLHETFSLLTWSMLHEFQCPRELLRQQHIGDKPHWPIVHVF